MDQTVPSEISIDEVMTRRFELDALIEDAERQHKLAIAPLTEELKLCETYVRSEMLRAGTQQWKSSTTGHETHFTTKSRSSVKDFDATLAEIREKGLWHLLTKAVSKEATKEYIEEYGKPPPGVEYTEFKDLAWRRGRA